MAPFCFLLRSWSRLLPCACAGEVARLRDGGGAHEWSGASGAPSVAKGDTSPMLRIGEDAD
jgi:hypothetical protein